MWLISGNSFFAGKLTEMRVTLAQCEWVTIYVLLPWVAATRSVLCKKIFLEISENLQEHTCVRVSFLIKLLTLAQVFSSEFWEMSKSTFFYRTHLWTTASISCSVSISQNALGISQIVLKKTKTIFYASKVSM